MRVFFVAAAREELDEIFAYLEEQQPGLGYRFTADVDEVLSRIQNHPLAWHALNRNYRRCHLRHFRYGVIYRIQGAQVVVYAIAHDRRRPGYWRNRKAE